MSRTRNSSGNLRLLGVMQELKLKISHSGGDSAWERRYMKTFVVSLALELRLLGDSEMSCIGNWEPRVGRSRG